jgi:thioesterase domain-containing protein
MLSEAQRALIAARLRRGRPDAQEGQDGGGPARPRRSTPLVELTGAGGDGPADRLFLVHAVGGAVHPYAPLAAQLAQDFTVYGIEAAGLAPGTEPAVSLDEMVENYLAAIRAAQPEGGPYRLAGWSMGGLVGYELARRLEHDGEKVDALILFDPPFAMPADLGAGPEGADGAAAESRAARWFVADVSRTLGQGGGPDEAPDPDASAAEQLDRLARRLGAGASAGGVAAGAGSTATAELADAMRAEIGRRYEVFRAHTRLIASYRPTAPLRTRTLVISAGQSPNAAVLPQWLELLGPAAATARTVDSDHYAFLGAPLVSEVGSLIRAWQEAR